MKIEYAIVFIFLAGAVLPFSQCCAAEKALDCTSDEENQHIKLKTMPVANGFEKVVLIDTAGDTHEYLVEGVKKIPLGDEKALFGSMISARTMGRQYELLLETDNYFEMYALHGSGRASKTADTVFYFERQEPAAASFSLALGRRVLDEHIKHGRVTFRCGNFREFLQYIEHRDPVKAIEDPLLNGIRERRMQDLSARFASAYVDHNLVFDNHFLGVETWQNPFDMWVFQQMITELKPDVIIETGTAHGGSALFFATILEKVNPHGRIITVEIDPDVDSNVSKARSFPVFSERVRIIKGDSVSARTLSRVQHLIDELAAAKIARHGASQRLTVLVTLDSLHSAEHVLEELGKYSRYVSHGSYIVVQDTIIDSNPKFIDWFVRPWVNSSAAKGSAAGPALAVQEFLEENRDFQRDKRWEKYYFTFYPGGFLKKIR